MTTEDVFKEITSIPKWYAGIMSAQNATNIKSRFAKNKVRPETITKLFNHFGYYKQPEQWKKK